MDAAWKPHKIRSKNFIHLGSLNRELLFASNHSPDLIGEGLRAKEGALPALLSLICSSDISYMIFCLSIVLCFVGFIRLNWNIFSR